MLGLILGAPLTSAGLHISRDLAASQAAAKRAAEGPPDSAEPSPVPG